MRFPLYSVKIFMAAGEICRIRAADFPDARKIDGGERDDLGERGNLFTGAAGGDPAGAAEGDGQIHI